MRFSNFSKYIYALLIVLVIAYCIKEAMGNGDFKVFLEAAKLVRDGENPYNKWIFVSEGNYCLYLYSPLWAVLLIPFTYLPSFIPNLIWLFANLFFLYRIFQLLKDFVDLNFITRKQLSWIVLLCIVMSIRFILYNFGMIQMTIFLLWGILEGLRLIRDKKVIYGGFLLALIINIKILPIVILPYLLYRNYRKGFASTLIFSIVLLFLPMFYLGWPTTFYLLTEWWSVINPSNPEHLVEADAGLHSLTALLPSLLTEVEGEVAISRNIFNLSENNANYILTITRISLVMLTLFFLKWPPFSSARNKLFQLRELAYIVLLIPLIFPHQQKYAFVLIIPAVFYLSHFMLINFSQRRIVMTNLRWYTLLTTICLSFILMTLSTDGVVGKAFYAITQHFKTITWGALALILALVLATPEITSKRKELQLTKNKQE